MNKVKTLLTAMVVMAASSGAAIATTQNDVIVICWDVTCQVCEINVSCGQPFPAPDLICGADGVFCPE